MQQLKEGNKCSDPVTDESQAARERQRASGEQCITSYLVIQRYSVYWLS